MSKATFYEHFSNKEDCIIALFDHAAEVVIRPSQAQAARAAGSGDARRADASRDAGVPDARSASTRSSRRRCWWRSSAPGRGRPTAATRSCRASPTSSTPRTRAAARRGLIARFASPLRRRARSSGAITELVSRQVRLGEPADVLELAPVIDRLIVGRAGDGRDPAVREPEPARRARAGRLEREVVDCRRCPRLVAWREEVARVRRAAFAERGVLGPPGAGIRRSRPPACWCSASRPRPTAATAPDGCSPAIAPATGCSRALWRAGFANQPTSRRAPTTVCALHDCYVDRRGALRAAGQPPLAGRARHCMPYLDRELALLRRAAGDRLPRRLRLGRALARSGRAAACERPGRGRASGTAPRARVRAAARCSAATTRASRTRSPAG